MSDRIWKVAVENRVVTSAFAALGGIWTSYQLYKLASFTHLHFLHRSSLDRYKETSAGSSESTWALVTGASDGIGKGFAEELCHRGFNVVLHARNEKKLNDVRDALLKQWPEREVRLLVIEAGANPFEVEKIEAAAEELKDLNLRVLINNVGGAGGAKPLFLPLSECDADRSQLFLDINARFTTEITRVLLPLLYKNSPAVILNTGSFIGEIAAPYLATYSGAKAYTKSWARSLDLEMRAERRDVEVVHIQVGQVSTAYDPRPESFLIPSSRRMASCSLDKIGCGQSIVFGYWPHILLHDLMVNVPTWIGHRVVAHMARGLKEKELEEMKEQ